MKRNLIMAAITVSLSITVGTGTYFLGKKSSTNNVNQGTSVSPTTSTNTTLEGGTDVTATVSPTAIAIVNQDEGTVFNGTSKNYATDIITAIGGEFTLVDRETAKNGVASGTYGAMIVLPGNFSNNIETINDDTPTKVEVYYEVNKKLDNESKLMINAKIQEFEKSLNNKLSYMYVTSIISQLHNAQDYTAMILSNDELDLEALNAINNIDLLKAINLTDLEDQNIDIENIDLSKNFEENTEIMNQLDTLYREKLLKSDQNVSSLKDELTTVLNDETTGLKAFRDKLQNMTTEQVKEAIAKSHEYSYEELKELYDTNLDTISKYIEDSLNGSLETIEEKGGNAFSKIGESVESGSQSASKISENATKEALDKLEEITDMSDLSSYNEEYLLYAEMVNELLKQNPELFEKVYTTVSEKGKVSYNKILKNPQGSNTSDNLFTDSRSLMTYLVDNSAANSDFIASRSEQYKKQIAEKISSNKAEGEKLASQFKVVVEETQKLTTSYSELKNNEDYIYVSGLFNKASEETFSSKIKNELLNEENKAKLDAAVTEENKTLVDDIKKVVENKIVTDGIVDFTKVITTFDKEYVSKIENITNMISTFEKTEDVQNDEAVISLWTKSTLNNSMLSSSIGTQIQNYNDVAQKSKEYAATHVQAMREYLDEGIKEAEENVNNALSEAKTKKEKTTYINKQKLAIFSRLLSNTRNGSIANGDVYSFIVNPAKVTQND